MCVPMTAIGSQRRRAGSGGGYGRNSESRWHSTEKWGDQIRIRQEKTLLNQSEGLCMHVTKLVNIAGISNNSGGELLQAEKCVNAKRKKRTGKKIYSK